jgi:peptide/nickel transport system permease protein
VGRFIRRRLLAVIPVLLLVSLGAFSLLELTPGDPVLDIVGPEATHEQYVAVKHAMGLDKSFISRYVDSTVSALHGDFGTSARSNQRVAEALKERLPVTMQVCLMALLIALALAVPLAVYCASHPDGLVDRLAILTSSVLIAAPAFISGLFASYFFAVVLGWFPVTGWTPLTEDVFDNLHHAILPALVLASVVYPNFLRVLRSDMIATLQMDFVLAARAKGLSPRYVLFRHALRPSSFSLITLAVLALGQLIAAAVLVEQIFALPGLGGLILSGIFQKDYPMVQGVTVFLAFMYVFLNASVDIGYALLDPRVRARVTA